jgi:hypothetical protein
MKHLFVCLAVVALALGIVSCSEDETTTTPAQTIVPINADFFPVVVGHQYVYTGYATQPGTGAQIPDPGGVYQTFWTVLAPTVPTPIGGTATAVKDSTITPVGSGVRTLLIKKDSVGDIHFIQSIGPFKRLFGISYGSTAADTLIWVAVARPSQGIGSTGRSWTAYDSTYTGTGGAQVRLQIFGIMEAQESIVDSSASHSTHSTYRSRTWRRITVSGTVVQDDATTSRIWFEDAVGPVQVRIVEDTENIGHFRVLESKNF